MSDAECGSWVLVQAYDKVENLEQLVKRAPVARMQKLPKEQCVSFDYSVSAVAEKAGYVVWKYSKVVLFYANDLVAATPFRPIIDGADADEAVMCVTGLAKLHRWTGTETMLYTPFDVPAIIVAYNMFMNSVDRMDQLRSTNPPSTFLFEMNEIAAAYTLRS